MTLVRRQYPNFFNDLERKSNLGRTLFLINHHTFCWRVQKTGRRKQIEERLELLTRGNRSLLWGSIEMQHGAFIDIPLLIADS